MASTPSHFWPYLASQARSSSSPDCDQFGENVAFTRRFFPGEWKGLPFTFGHLMNSRPTEMSSLVTGSPNVAWPSFMVKVASVSVAPPEYRSSAGFIIATT